MRALLLLWIGDYQGQGKICGMKHSGKQACHWCMQVFRKGLGTTGSCFADNIRRYMPEDSPYRHDNTYGEDQDDPADNVPPANRTPEEVWRVGADLTAGDNSAAETKHIQETTGIDEVCILGLLPMFCIILDICLDMMHVIKNLWQEHLLPLFRGNGCPSKPRTPAYKKNGRNLVGEAKAAAVATGMNATHDMPNGKMSRRSALYESALFPVHFSIGVKGLKSLPGTPFVPDTNLCVVAFLSSVPLGCRLC
jgi:hypothetical protein